MGFHDDRGDRDYGRGGPSRGGRGGGGGGARQTPYGRGGGGGGCTAVE
jgi:hypothetical protein